MRQLDEEKKSAASRAFRTSYYRHKGAEEHARGFQFGRGQIRAFGRPIVAALGGRTRPLAGGLHAASAAQTYKARTPGNGSRVGLWKSIHPGDSGGFSRASPRLHHRSDNRIPARREESDSPGPQSQQRPHF